MPGEAFEAPIATILVNLVGRNLRELRLSRGLKQEDIASSLGVSSPTYSSWERGRTEPNIAYLRELARIFDVSVDRLIFNHLYYFDIFERRFHVEHLPTPYIIPQTYVEAEECFEGTGPYKLVDEGRRMGVREGLQQRNWTQRPDYAAQTYSIHPM